MQSEERVKLLKFACRSCGALEQQPCRTKTGQVIAHAPRWHKARFIAAGYEQFPSVTKMLSSFKLNRRKK